MKVGPTKGRRFSKTTKQRGHCVMNAPSFGVPPHNAANAESTFPTCAFRDGPLTRVPTISLFVPSPNADVALPQNYIGFPLPPQVQCMRPSSSNFSVVDPNLF